jgi:hypothetical protein
LDRRRQSPWPPKSTTWEEYKAEKDKLDSLAGQRIEINEYRDGVLGSAKNRLKDEDNPPNKSELQNILRDIDAKMPASVKQEYGAEDRAVLPSKPSTGSAADDYANSSGLNAPVLTADFKAAHDGISGEPAPAPLPSLILKSAP